MSPDASNLNEDVTDPSSWNAYSYSESDPINFFDPEGTTACGDLNILAGNQNLGQAVTAKTDLGLLGRVVWAESDHTWSRQLSMGYYNEQDAIAWSVVNRWNILHGNLSVSGVTNPATLGWGPINATYSDILGKQGQFSTISFTRAGTDLRSDLTKTLNGVLSSVPTQGDSVALDLRSFGLGNVTMTHGCLDVWQSWVAAKQAMEGDSKDPFASKGYTTSFHYGSQTGPLEPFFGNFGDSNNFFGISVNQVSVNPSPVLPNPVRPRRRQP